MANTHVKIGSTITASGSVSSVTFSSIPQTYTDLKLVVSSRGAADWNDWSVNGQSAGGGNWTMTHILNFNGSIYSQNYTYGRLPTASTSYSAASSFSNGQAYFHNYAGSTTKLATVNALSIDSSAYRSLHIGTFGWDSTAAITSLTVTCSGSTNYTAGSTFSLYGIKNN